MSHAQSERALERGCWPHSLNFSGPLMKERGVTAILPRTAPTCDYLLENVASWRIPMFSCSREALLVKLLRMLCLHPLCNWASPYSAVQVANCIPTCLQWFRHNSGGGREIWMGAFTLQVRSEANQARGGGQCRGECALPPVELFLLSLFLVISSFVSSFFSTLSLF